MKIVRLPRSYEVTASGTVGEANDIDTAFSENTKKIILAVSHIESQIERQILEYLFPSLTAERKLFESSVLMASFFTTWEKCRVFLDILKTFPPLTNADIDSMEKLLRKAIDYRNAFTHGRISYGQHYEATLSFFKAGPREAKISDEYLTQLEEDLISCSIKIEKLMLSAGVYRPPEPVDDLPGAQVTRWKKPRISPSV